MGTKAIQEDMARLRLLRRTKRQLAVVDVKVRVPRIAWRISGDSQVDNAAAKAATMVIRGQWNRAQFRNAAVALIQSEIDAIAAKYPSINVED